MLKGVFDCIMSQRLGRLVAPYFFFAKFDFPIILNYALHISIGKSGPPFNKVVENQ